MNTITDTRVIDREKTNILTVFEKNGIRYVRYEFNDEIKELEEDLMKESFL